MGMRNLQRRDRIPQTVSLRDGQPRDTNYLKDIDLKSYHYPWGGDKWKLLDEKDHSVCLAIEALKPVGFVIWKGEKALDCILRLAVKPQNRGRGIGTMLLDRVFSAARVKRFREISTVVPEIHCLPGHPDDVSQWLLAYGFLARPPIIKEYAQMYGELVDGFQFFCEVD